MAIWKECFFQQKTTYSHFSLYIIVAVVSCFAQDFRYNKHTNLTYKSVYLHICLSVYLSLSVSLSVFLSLSSPLSPDKIPCGCGSTFGNNNIFIYRYNIIYSNMTSQLISYWICFYVCCLKEREIRASQKMSSWVWE